MWSFFWGAATWASTVFLCEWNANLFYVDCYIVGFTRQHQIPPTHPCGHFFEVQLLEQALFFVRMKRQPFLCWLLHSRFNTVRLDLRLQMSMGHDQDGIPCQIHGIDLSHDNPTCQPNCSMILGNILVWCLLHISKLSIQILRLTVFSP